MGLKHVTLPDIISNHVLPALPASDAESHTAYLALIVSSGLTAPEALNASLAAKIIDGIKAHGSVVTNQGIKQLGRDFLHLPVSLGNKVILHSTLLHLCSVHLSGCSHLTYPFVLHQTKLSI